MKTHSYATCVNWVANGAGTTSYHSYLRDFTVAATGKPEIPGSSDPAFRGNASRFNPEELLVASLSACHMLWYLHLCSRDGVTVLSYRDHATGAMELDPDGAGQFVRVDLRPEITVSDEDDRARAFALHEEAHRLCFIARSVNFPVVVEAEIAPACRIREFGN